MCEGRSHPSHAPVEYTWSVHQVADRSPRRTGDIAAPMYVAGEERAKPRELARRIGASLRVGTGVYSATATRAGSVSGASLAGVPRKRSSSHPKTSAMVPQTSI
jgi:hypothetical protein